MDVQYDVNRKLLQVAPFLQYAQQQNSQCELQLKSAHNQELYESSSSDRGSLAIEKGPSRARAQAKQH